MFISQGDGPAVDEFECGDGLDVAQDPGSRNQGIEVGESAQRGRPVGGYRMQAQVHRGDHAEGALRTSEQCGQVISGVGSARRRAGAQHRSVGKCDLEAEYLFAHGAVANRVESTGVGGDHPADGGRVTGSQVHADEQSGRCRGALRLRQRDAGAHPNPPCGRVDVADAVQSLGG